MTLEALHQKIEGLARKVFDEAGMELVELKFSGPQHDVFIQITADKPSGGINIHECAILNKALVALIEQESVLPPENFSLELSSPGLDRPLVTRRDFLRHIGHELDFRLKGPVGTLKKNEIQGKLLEVTESVLIIETPKQPRLQIPFGLVIKALLVI